MGIEFSHDAWRSSYYAFDLWRRKIFELAGFGDLRTIDGYFDPADDDDWPDGVPDGTVVRDLREVMPKSHPLYPLIAMSDTPGSGEAPRPHRIPSLAQALAALLLRHADQWPTDLRASVEEYVSGQDIGEAYIRHSALPPLAKALERILADNPGAMTPDFEQATRQFIEGCRRAHEAGENLIAH